MGISVETLAVAKKYTNRSIEGITGTLAGKNATIESITDITGGHRVTFKWTADNGDVRTQTMDVMNGADGQDGEDGKGIKSVAVNSSNHLIITYDDDTIVDAGEIDIHSAVNSVNGKTGNVDLTASDVGAYSTSDVDTVLADKVDKVQGKGLSTNDYTDADKAEVAKVTDKADADDVIDSASYDSTNHQILFKNGATTLFSLDAAAFVKDGMVDTVTITGGNLVITFNTDAGKQAISIPITDIFDPANYYDKTATDNLLADKADKTDVDSAIAEQQNLLKDTVGWTGKNLLPYPYRDGARTYNGVTYVYNSDNTITANGTATSTSWRTLTEDFSFLELGKKYRLSGCPTGGSSNSYLVQLTYNDGTEKFLKDYGDGIEFTYTGDFIRLQVIVRENYTANNLVFKPMIRRADITDDTYEPYHESVEVMYEEEIHGVNLFDDSKIEVGKAWNGDTNANRARNIIPCEPNSEYIVSMNGTNGLDSVFFSVSENIPPASQTAITSFPYTIRTGISDRYITLGFNKTNIALSDVTSLKIMLRKADIEDSTYRPYNEQAIQNQLNAQGVLGAKNWLPNIVTNQTKNGITWTKNSDGTLTANGTATAASEVAVVSPNTYDTAGLLQSGQKYIYSIGIPLNMLSTYGIEAYGDFRNDTDTGWEDGLPIDTPFSGKPNKVGFYIRVKNGITVNNLVFKPMVRLASDPDDTYVPYAPTNAKLNEEKMSYADNGVLGTKNLLPQVEHANTTMTINGVTITSREDGSVLLNGTSTAAVSYHFIRLSSDTNRKFIKQVAGKKVTISGTNVLNTNVRVQFWSTTTNVIADVTGKGTTFTIPSDLATTDDYNFAIWIPSGSTINNIIVYPMLRLASDPDDTYQPYAMTNRELTDKILEKKVLTSADDLNDVIETGLYVIRDGIPTNSPENTNWCSLLVNNVSDNNVQQQLFKGEYLYQRKYSGVSPAWGSWYKFTGTIVS